MNSMSAGRPRARTTGLNLSHFVAPVIRGRPAPSKSSSSSTQVCSTASASSWATNSAPAAYRSKWNCDQAARCQPRPFEPSCSTSGHSSRRGGGGSKRVRTHLGTITDAIHQSAGLSASSTSTTGHRQWGQKISAERSSGRSSEIAPAYVRITSATVVVNTGGGGITSSALATSMKCCHTSACRAVGGSEAQLSVRQANHAIVALRRPRSSRRLRSRPAKGSR